MLLCFFPFLIPRSSLLFSSLLFVPTSVSFFYSLVYLPSDFFFSFFFCYCFCDSWRPSSWLMSRMTLQSTPFMQRNPTICGHTTHFSEEKNSHLWLYYAIFLHENHKLYTFCLIHCNLHTVFCQKKLSLFCLEYTIAIFVECFVRKS